MAARRGTAPVGLLLLFLEASVAFQHIHLSTTTPRRWAGEGSRSLGLDRRTRFALRMQSTSQPVAPAAPVRSLDDVDNEKATSPLLEKLEAMEGIWFSDDFYGTHGREWVEVRSTLIGAGRPALVAVKATGDANVPSGFTTWRTTGGLPSVGGPEVPGEIQIRSNPRDPNGFSWVPGSLAQSADDRIQVTAIYDFGMRHTGTFHKHKVGEGGA